MSPHLPELIDPWRWAELGRRVSGRIETAGLKRLSDLISGVAPEVEVDLAVEQDDQGRIIVSGRVCTELTLECQRCLESMPYPVDVRFRLAVIESAGEAERLPEALEPLLISEGRLRVLDVIEDELLLSLPLVPKHAPEQCAVYREGSAAPQEVAANVGPFAVLGALKQRQDSNS